MKSSLCRTLVAAWLCVAATASAAPKVEWRIEGTEDRDGNPHSRVDLVINGTQVVHVVTPEEGSRYGVLAPADYADHKVPATALCACASWWAGSGTDYYVVAGRKGRLNLFRRDVDEAVDGRYEKDRTIKVESP